MKDSTTADARHHEHETRAAGRPDTAGPRFHGVTDLGRLALPAAMVLSGIVLGVGRGGHRRPAVPRNPAHGGDRLRL